VTPFVGRARARTRLLAAHRAAVAAPGAAVRRPGLILVTGEAGIGKTALLTRYAADVAAGGAAVCWGTSWDDEQAPAWWPWTQALRALLRDREDLRPGAPAELAAVLPELPALRPSGDGEAARPRVFDAVAQTLARAAVRSPVVVILDDLQWADPSTAGLLRYVARQPLPGAVVLVGAYRPSEARAGVAADLAELAGAAELLTLRGLDPDEVAELVRAVSGRPAADRWAALVHQRSGGHPFFARELCRLLDTGAATGAAPAAVRDVIARRLARLSDGCRALLDAAAVAGQVLPDVLAEVTGRSPSAVADLITEAATAGVVRAAGPDPADARFAHDLFRETIAAGLPAARRLDLHHRVARALAHRLERGGSVFPAELARQFAAAIGVAGTGPALSWAYAAAEADRGRFAFAEAAGHLARVRAAAAGAGQQLTGADLVGLGAAEADLRLRAGDAAAARTLLDDAWRRALATGEADLLAAVALGLDRVGARFAMPRDDLTAALGAARDALAGRGSSTEAQVTAALARQLQHSVPAERPQARPLAEAAVAIARRLDEPATLATCLLAQHDVLWTPGTAGARAAIAAEIATAARRAGDPERLAQAALLSATAQLEGGSPGFRATLAEFRYVTERLRQPRHDYLLRTRAAALALLDGDVEAGDRLSAEAVRLGEAAGDTDTGNVRMTQRLEIARARADPAELCATAAEAVSWWIGLPAHAHAVAAGFCARAGDLDRARQELDTVLALPEWRTDRSYMWSLFVGELIAAAIAVGDRPLCRVLRDDLTPFGDTCAVGGALVVFMGAHAHRLGLLHAALGDRDEAVRCLTDARATHRRLGARAWAAESDAALAALDAGRPARPARVPAPAGGAEVVLRRTGDMWQAGFGGRTAYLRDIKGLHDLAVLLARPGVDVPALELAGGHRAVDRPAAAEPVLDAAALTAYRRRLADLDERLSGARADADLGGQRRAADEREILLAELRRATRPGGQARRLGPSAAERARKAVTARIRDAIRRIATALPELGVHLDRTVRTGTTCRYDPGA
jgi:hypothetical protein